ncbi:MAG TPA: sulfite reductase subunit alpha [Pedomonas sp.]|uniref:sulfite reductase subunit alpha n=1 Tax=Pedomonas sp. TaxID=2976421 RepID=UPI002F3FF732
MSPELRLAYAFAVALLYGLFCLWIARRHKMRKQQGVSLQNGSEDASLLVAYASQSGFAEYLAGRTAESLSAAGRTVTLLPLEQVHADTLATFERALFIVSTTGEGDAPTHAFRFVSKVMSASADFSRLRYGVLALGDRSYANFCAFGRQLDDWLRAAKATPLFERIEVDNGADASIAAWKEQLTRLGASENVAISDGPQFAPWVLAERTLLNPGSIGGPAYLVRLRASSPDLAWEAGDIAEIELPGHAPEASGHPPHRSYSIASLPADGMLDLIVRQVRHEEGQLGAGSGWLTHHAPVGGTVPLRIRRNSSFHPQEALRPLILIGNGTGLAGLRAHLKAQAASGEARNWLIFGERNRAHDFFLREELEAWQASGVLERLDLAFSRDQEARVYVQHRLLEARDSVAEWVSRGAAIYVCGSAEGMAGDVHAALADILGDAQLAQLTEDGLYRRDVY